MTDQHFQKVAAPIRLAEQRDFTVGTLRIQPSRGEMNAAGKVTRLEPRLMEVLIVLAQNNGATVSRQELRDRCWGGLLVSPDAVNRTISLLRRLLEQHEAGVQLKTLPKIGYQLVQGASLAVREQARPADASPNDSSETTSDPLVRDLFARALVGLEQPAREPLEQSQAYLKQAVSRAPNFALGWAALAEAQRMLMLYLPAPMQGAARAESRRSVERALALNPRLGQAYGTLANLLPRFTNWSDVESLFEQGLKTSPGNGALLHAYAQFLLSVGRTAEAVRRLATLRGTNPLSAAVVVDLAAALFDRDDESEAIATIEEAYQLWPGIMLIWSECVRMHVVAGNYERASALLDAPPPQIAPDDPNLARRRLHLIARRDRRPSDIASACKNFLHFSTTGIAPATVSIHALTTLDQADDAMQIADEIFRSDSPQSRMPGVNMMGTYTLAGQPDCTVLFRRDTQNLRHLPRFSGILERTGLQEYWGRSGCTPDFVKGGLANSPKK